MKKKDLYAYLDAFTFSEIAEIEMAVSDYFREFVEKDEDYQPSWWEIAYYAELAEEYVNEKTRFLELNY